ncbi:50S ribosomal protein L20 [Candidatus Peregrinibacteria bacterium]|nr:50S ribosomal protein L20 [Candidatus Peregrinibacteria bacterium]
MPRVKRGVTSHRRHKKIVGAAKGYKNLRGRTFKASHNAWMKAGINAYESRRLKKRTFRGLWITRINAACRPMGISYSRLIEGMTKKGVLINRKMLSELAINEPEVFKKVVEEAR